MKFLKIEILLIALISLVLLTGVVQINFVNYKFSNVVTTMIDTDWKGTPYVVKELGTQNRSYEDGALSFGKPQRDVRGIITTSPYYMVDLIMDGKKYLESGNHIEVCLQKEKVTIDIIKEGWYESEYSITSLYNYAYHRLDNVEYYEDDYQIEFKANLTAKGIMNRDYIHTQVNEFILYRTFELFDEYHAPEETIKRKDMITQIQMAISYITGRPLKSV